GLREAAMQAIKNTQWIPSWGQARIEGMVNGRPDWCISRQRTWGVPITLFVHKQSGELHPETDRLLEEVAKRVEKSGIDAWFSLDPSELLCDAAADYDKVPDTLDVWFDSGVTHAAVLDKHPDLHAPADLYLEGSDQHRGWFQSSLLTSVAIRNAAPYKAVLTHGFTVDAKGQKMSKSKGNVVDPDLLVEKFGTDTVRIFSMFAAPPERDLEWSDQGVEGALRFLNRIWTFIYKNHGVLSIRATGQLKDVSHLSASASQLLRKTHQTIKKVTNSIERDYHFNTAIAALMELVNETLAFSPSDEDEMDLLRYTVRQVILLLSPFAPHFSEELWREIGERHTLCNETWPSWNEDIAKDEEIELVVQINGKVRARTTIAAGLDDETVRESAFGDAKIQELIKGKTPRKVIVVQGRLVNIVI
ncbi:MAG TPA: hypothetical protein DDX85_13925, partial [Nitrospiraceae bacterium]|nr:hypothetical protein [Nitrospiraceae bacterium]